MGSDWVWELWGRSASDLDLRALVALADDYGLGLRRPDGRINLFTNPDADMRTVDDLDVALGALESGAEHSQFWAGDVDIFLNWEGDQLMWALQRSAADRDLHARLTALWLAVARQVNAHIGRVLDEWSTEQIWTLGVAGVLDRGDGWPGELGWWTYVGPGRAGPPPQPDLAARTRTLPGGAQLLTLLDDPAEVDPVRYQKIHERWLGTQTPG